MASGTLAHFKATLARKKERNIKKQARSTRQGAIYSTSSVNPKFNSPKISDEELEKIKAEIRKKLKSQKRKEQIIIIVSIALLFLFISFFIF